MAPLKARRNRAADAKETVLATLVAPRKALVSRHDLVDYSKLSGFTSVCEEIEALGEDFCAWSDRPNQLREGGSPMAIDAEFLEPLGPEWRPVHTLLVLAVVLCFLMGVWQSTSSSKRYYTLSSQCRGCGRGKTQITNLTGNKAKDRHGAAATAVADSEREQIAVGTKPATECCDRGVGLLQ